jgi:hypothetical protein
VTSIFIYINYQIDTLTMKSIHALEGGLAGAAAITFIHETVKITVPKAPRLDLLGMKALSRGLKIIGKVPPSKTKLYGWSLAGDMVSNALFYSIAGIGSQKNALLRGAALGFSAGMAAVLLPKPLGLPESPTNRSIQTKLMTIGLYTLGGVVASAVMKAINNKQQRRNAAWEERLVTSSMV